MSMYKNLIPTVENSIVPAVTNDVTGDQTVGTNALQGETDPLNTLWSVVLEKAVDATAKVLMPIASTTFTTEEAFRYIPASAGEAKPNIQVLVINEAGAVTKDGTSDWNSAMQSKVVSVPLTRYSRSFGISMYDAMKGHSPEKYLTAVINAVKQEIAKDFVTTVTGAGNEVEVSAITPATLAHTVSAAFGDYGDVESLVLTPANYAQLIPDSALSLKLTEGAYGIGAIYKSAGIPEGTEGYAYNRDGVAAAFARPAWAEMPGVEIYEFESEGIPFRLKISADADHNILYHTVDVLFGCAIANSKHIAKVVLSA